MDNNFKYIKNRISEYRKDDLINLCHKTIDNNWERLFPIWSILTLIKWAYMFGGRKYPSKNLTYERFKKLFDLVNSYSDKYITRFLDARQARMAFQIIYTQQIYLQVSVYEAIFATQLKLFSTIGVKYKIGENFENASKISILDYLRILQSIWIFLSTKIFKYKDLLKKGYVSKRLKEILVEVHGEEKVNNFFSLLTFDENNLHVSFSLFKQELRTPALHPLGMSLFVLFPFVFQNGKLKLIHTSIFKYTVNYYIYDYLRGFDSSFTTNFGIILEKYTELGLNEINVTYKNEQQLKSMLPLGSKLVDFIMDDNIFIECKATELQPLPSVEPTDESLYNSLRTSIFKAYFEQLITVSKYINSSDENWGIIITYKPLFWGHFPDLFEMGKDKYKNLTDYNHLPPENVFIIDIYTWDKVMQIIKDYRIKLVDILIMAKNNNSKEQSRKLLFDMHLDIYPIKSMNLKYLEEERKALSFSQDNGD